MKVFLFAILISVVSSNFLATVTYPRSRGKDVLIAGHFDQINQTMQFDYSYLDGRPSESKLYWDLTLYYSRAPCVSLKFPRIDSGYWDLTNLTGQSTLSKELSRQIALQLTGSWMGELLSLSSNQTLTADDGSWLVEFIKY